VLVADYGNHRIQELPSLGRDGAAMLLGVGLLQKPDCVALTSTETAIVVQQSDVTNPLVVLARNGASILRVLPVLPDMIGQDWAWGLAVSRSGVVAVSTCEKDWVFVCDVGGQWKRKIDVAGYARGVAFDSRERLVVIEIGMVYEYMQSDYEVHPGF